MTHSVRAVAVGLVLAALALLGLATTAKAAQPSYLAIRIEGVINPVKARYVARAMERARAEHADFVLVSIDTPGGLIVSMEAIAKSFTNGRTPVVGFVWPKTAEATSAGALILLATDVAAMAPDTRVGSAHPVGPDGANLPSTMDQKATQSMLALAKSLAARSGRPASFAEAIVDKSASYTAVEAKELRAIEILAADRSSLLAQLDGRKLERDGVATTLHTRGATAIDVPLSSAERVLDVLAEPTIASMLLSIGVLAILYEIASPGVGMAGIIGVLSVILGLTGVSILPVRAAAALLGAAGLVAIALEAKVSMHGLLALGGVVGVVLSALFLVDESAYFGALQALKWQFFAPFLLAIAAVFLLVLRAVRSAMGGPVQTGSEALVGRTGTVKGSFRPQGAQWVGTAFVDGARWKAESNAALSDGQAVRVLAVLTDPTRLSVEPRERRTDSN